MISYIVRLIGEFKNEHGYQPNLLYLNEFHFNHLKAGFSEDFTLQRMCELFHMELIVNREVIHPHVAWTHIAHQIAV
jgi:hypothetical protein